MVANTSTEEEFDFLEYSANPFDDGKGGAHRKVHIYHKQRRGRTCFTTIHHLSEEYDLQRISKALRKMFKCSGSVKKDELHDNEEVIKLSGDHRAAVASFLITEGICDKEQVVVH
jgi:translation initiation factor SUI1